MDYLSRSTGFTKCLVKNIRFSISKILLLSMKKKSTLTYAFRSSSKSPAPTFLVFEWKFLPLFVFLIYFTIFINFFGVLLFKFLTFRLDFYLYQLNLELLIEISTKFHQILSKKLQNSIVTLAISWIEKILAYFCILPFLNIYNLFWNFCFPLHYSSFYTYKTKMIC